MERKDDPLRPHLHQGRELRQFTEGEAVAPPQKIEHFLRHARAALQRLQPSGISVASLGCARRVLVAPTSSSIADSSNPFPDTRIESDAGIRMMRDSHSNPTDLVLSERLLDNLASRACQANPANSTQQEKFESKRRKGDSDQEADDTSLDSARNMKLFSGKDENMEAIARDSEFLHICEPLVSTQRSVVEQSFSVSNCPNAIIEFKVSSCDGVLVGDACENSSQANHHCKSTLADGLQKVPVSSFSVTNLNGTYLAKGSVGNIQRVDSRDASSDMTHPAMVSNNTLMHTDKDTFDPMDTTTLTCGSSSHYNGSIICNQVEPSALNKQVLKDQDYVNQHMIGNNAGAEEVHMGGAGSFEMKNSVMTGGPNERFIGVTGKEPSNPPTTASSVATATSLQCTPAAPLNSTTHNPSFYRNVSLRCSVREPVGQSDLNGKHFSNQSKAFDNQSDLNILSAASIGMPLASVSQTSGIHDQGLVQRRKPFKQEIVQPTDPRSDSVKCLKDNPVPNRGNEVPDAGNAVLISYTKALPSEPRNSLSNTHAVASVANTGKLTSEKESAASRKKHYDPDVFFKVNGKLYQKLGRIGTGGSSEVYKVISSDCTIYALKKIKLKGRDYSTAYGFCQEVNYLNRLRGKNNIIQLIDFEVTDKQFLEAAINDVVPVKDGRINDETYIYMVLEYGEIDLAHMLSQKWKEMESSNTEIDQNWLRFYWQQILRSVNTIHDERIVHSDLKPANFLLVKGSLKLIDFGIAKAIQSDTTNIQRDSQVGTLNYMSPEAFLCNEQDSDGNNIKCGRPSDIWSLGCILYQMVYGKTPFAEYKTFWAKFKVITDRNHAINYGPVSNPWLVDLMKKCLAWDRHERWRIPQLLQHPFLAPPMASGISSALGQCKILSQIAKHHGTEPQVSLLCDQLKELIIKLQSEN